MEELLEAGVHFGHQTRRWNPKMKRFIYSSRNDIYIIDLRQTVERMQTAFNFTKEVASRGEHILFVGTKKQAQGAVQDAATCCGMYYVNQRWLGGMLTNFRTIKSRIERLRELERMRDEGFFERLPKKEVKRLSDELEKLQQILGGIKEMPGLPSAVFVVDLKKDEICVKEARKLGIPVVGIVDTNCDPDEVDYPIPGNDDAVRAIKLVSGKIADAVLAGKAILEALEVKEEVVVIEPVEVAEWREEGSDSASIEAEPEQFEEEQVEKEVTE